MADPVARRNPIARKVLLVGWDAADWKVITPLLDAGKMPNLESLINQGVMGNLASLRPQLSPMLWTSIATGKRPLKHGIHGFSEPDPSGTGIRPVTILSRKTKALWNILCQSGFRSNVVGWWPSHPAEPINGVMVSNHYQRATAPLGQPWPLMPGTVHPPRLVEPLAGLRVHPQELTDEHIGPFVPEFGRIDQDKDHRLESLAKIICECSSIHAAATAIMQLEPWDFMGVYYDAIDHFCHGFMRYHPPRQDHVDEADFEIYQGVVESGYRYHDMMLGTLLALAGEETTVILVSDHGFHPDHLRPRSIPSEPAGPAAEHRDYGIVVMKGPDIRQDERVYGATLLDICPTVLTLFGLPVGRDMDGKALVTAFETPPAIEAIPSWDDVPGADGRHPPDLRIEPGDATEALKQLVALGYIEKPDDDATKAVEQTVRELRYNLARDYMDAGRHQEAATLLEPLLAKWPDEYRFAILLATCYQALERISEARRVIDEVLERKGGNAREAQEKLAALQKTYEGKKPDELSDEQKLEMHTLRREAGWNPYALEFLLGSLCFAEENDDAALAHLRKAEQSDANQPGLHVKIGEVYLRMKRPADAERSFLRAIGIDPECAPAHLGLCRSHLAERRSRDAAEAALKAVGLQYFNPFGHFLLGLALHRLNRIDRAVQALQVAVAQNPNFVLAHRRLAVIYDRRLRDPDRAAEHSRLAVVAQERLAELSAARGVGAAAPTAEELAVAGPPQAAGLPAREPESSAAIEALDAADAAPGDLADTITIVSGLPRSGTSMMMQMLAAGGLDPLTDARREADADNPRGYFEFRRAMSLPKDSSWLPEARGRAVKIVAQLLPGLPADPALGYRIVFMERPFEEVLPSQRKMLGRLGEQGAELPDEKLRDVFAEQVRRVRRILAARRIPALAIAYRDCVADPAAVAARVNAFLGGQLDEAAMAAAVDPALHRNRADGEPLPAVPA